MSRSRTEGNNLSHEVVSWSAGLAARLRIIQMDSRTLPPSETNALIHDEIDRALRAVLPEQRAQYLATLAGCFPGEEGASSFGNGARGEVERVEQSPEALTHQLVEMAAVLPKRKLLELGIRLQQAGFMEVQTTTLLDEPPEEFTHMFHIEGDAQIDLQRMYRLLQVLTEFLVGLDKVAWPIWRFLAPVSRIRKEGGADGDFRNLAGRYVTGDEEVAQMQVSQLVERLRQVVAGVLAGLGHGTRAFARKHQSRFSPDAIRELAGMERKGPFVTIEHKCWEKYCQLSAEITEEGMAKDLCDAIARYAEDLIKGIASTPNN